MRNPFTHPDGRLRTGRTAALVFCLMLLALSLAFQASKPLDRALVNVKHVFEPQPAPPAEPAEAEPEDVEKTVAETAEQTVDETEVETESAAVEEPVAAVEDKAAEPAGAEPEDVEETVEEIVEQSVEQPVEEEAEPEKTETLVAKAAPAPETVEPDVEAESAEQDLREAEPEMTETPVAKAAPAPEAVEPDVEAESAAAEEPAAAVEEKAAEPENFQDTAEEIAERDLREAEPEMTETPVAKAAPAPEAVEPDVEAKSAAPEEPATTAEAVAEDESDGSQRDRAFATLEAPKERHRAEIAHGAEEDDGAPKPVSERKTRIAIDKSFDGWGSEKPAAPKRDGGGNFAEASAGIRKLLGGSEAEAPRPQVPRRERIELDVSGKLPGLSATGKEEKPERGRFPALFPEGREEAAAFEPAAPSPEAAGDPFEIASLPHSFESQEAGETADPGEAGEDAGFPRQLVEEKPRPGGPGIEGARREDGAITVGAGDYRLLFGEWMKSGAGEVSSERPPLRVANLENVYKLFQMKPVAVVNRTLFIDLGDGSRLSEASLRSYSRTVFRVDRPWQKWGRALKSARVSKSDRVEVRYYMYPFIERAIYARANRALEWFRATGAVGSDVPASQVDILGRAFAINRAGGGKFGVFVPVYADVAAGGCVPVDVADCFRSESDIQALRAAGLI